MSNVQTGGSPTPPTYGKMENVWSRDPSDMSRLIPGAWKTPEFAFLQDCVWEWTEKIDGTNIRVWHDGERMHFAGRTDRAQLKKELADRLTELFAANTALRPGMCLYGEGFGAGIQKGGGLYVPDGKSVDFILFDVLINPTVVMHGGTMGAGPYAKWLERDSVTEVADSLGVRLAPVVGSGGLIRAIDMVRSGFDSIVAEGRRKAEGLVCRCPTWLRDRFGNRLICKIKSRDFPQE